MKTASRSTRNLLAAALTLAAVLAPLAHAQVPESMQPGTEAAATATPGILLAFITAGTPDPAGKVPALNAVAGSKVLNLSVAFPETVLIHGLRYNYLAALQSTTYTGAYTVTYSLTHVVAGKTVVLQSGTIAANKSTQPGNVWAWVTAGPAIPNTPGLALLTAQVKYGALTQTISTTVLIK